MVRTACFEYAQNMGYRLPEPESTKKKVIKVISARRRAEKQGVDHSEPKPVPKRGAWTIESLRRTGRKPLDAKQEAEKKAELEAFMQGIRGTGLTESSPKKEMKPLERPISKRKRQLRRRRLSRKISGSNFDIRKE